MWALALVLLLWPGLALAEAMHVVVDLSEQRMVVTRDRAVVGDWPVSTARAGKVTPLGRFHPQSLERMHYSTLYDGAPMPWSIFFRGNYAIHGTTQVQRLGSPASAGCIRLAPENAKSLYDWVREVGFAETLIEVVP